MRPLSVVCISGLVLLMASYSPSAVPGCECSDYTVSELVRQPIIFIGEVVDGGITSTGEDPWRAAVDHVRFKVTEHYRGLPRTVQTVDLVLLHWPGMCAPIPYYVGKKYLVVPSKREKLLTDGPCLQGRDVERYSELVSEVRNHFKGNRVR